MRARVLVVFTLFVGLFVGLMSGQASALSPGVAFSATDLPTWQANGVVWAVGASKGKVVAGGTFSQIRPPDGAGGTPQSRNALAIFDAQTGNPDSCQFNVSLSGGTPTVRAITTSDDGNTVYIGGNFTHINGASVTRVAALDVGACTVKSFRVSATSSFVHALAIHDNTLYMAGAFSSVAGEQRLRFAAVNATTGALLPFVADADDTGRGIAVSPDGSKVALGGDIFSINGQFSHSIAMVDAVTGANIRTYPSGFIHSRSMTKHIYSGDDGRFYISNEGTGGGVFDGRAAFDWETGDQVWRDNCLGATQATIEYQGTIYSASHAHNCSSNGAFGEGRRNYLLAQDAETGEQYGWYPRANDGIGEGIGPRAFAVATGRDGRPYLWVSGEFTRINGELQQSLTRFDTINREGPGTPAPVAEAMSDGSIQVRLRTVVDPDDSVLTYRVYRNGSSTPIEQVEATSTWWKRPQVNFVDHNVTPGTRYTYRVTASDGVNSSALSAVDAATATAPTNDYVSRIRADNPDSLWSSNRTGSWVEDRGADTSDVGQSALSEQGVGDSTDSPLAGDPTGSLSFDGSDDYLWNDNYAPAPNTYTVETWFKTNTTRGGKIIGFGNERPRTDNGNTRLSGNYDRQLYMENSGRLRFGIWTGSAQTVRTPSSYNDNQWHHVIGTQGPNGLALYVDGRRIGTNSATTGQAYWGVWHVGGDQLNGWPDRPSSNFFAGLIDETAIYGRALGARTVADHYVASGRSLNVNAAPADAYGAAVFEQDPSLYWRLSETSGLTAADSSYFGQTTGTYGLGVTRNRPGIVDGNAAIGTPGNTLGTVATQVSGGTPAVFTTQVWFRTSTNSGGKIFGFENTQTGTGNSYDKQLYMRNDGRLTFGTYTGSVSTVTTDASYNDGAWHQATAVLDAGGTKLYVDGALRASNGTTTSENITGYWRLGGGNLNGWPGAPSNYFFSGDLDEFAVYPTGLPANVLANLYAVGIADDEPPTTPTGLSGSATAQGVQLSWTASQDNTAVASYQVHRGQTAGFTPSEQNLVDETNDTSYLDESATAGEHYYRVVAVDVAGNRSTPSSSVSVTVADTEAPTTPADVNAEQAGADVDVSWSASSDNVGVTGYHVHRGATAGFTPGSGNLINEVTGTSYTDNDPGPGDYFYKIIAVDAAGNGSDPSSAAAVTVTAPDTTPPDAPQGLAAAATGSRIDLQWTAATDDTAVTGYHVHRSANPGFTPGTGNLFAEVTGTSYADSGLDEGTYYYLVTAGDAAGNVSDPSNEASATIEAEPVEPTEIAIDPDADAAVHEVVPNGNYGGNSQLWSRGETGQQAFLKFTLPSSPAGTVLTSAELRFRTSGDPIAGSTDTNPVDLVSGNWTEGGLTWNNRPTLVGANLGSITGATNVNTPYTMPVSVGSLQDVMAQQVSVRISGTGSDNLRLWSRDVSTANYRPQLILTFSGSGQDSDPPSSPTGLTANADQDAVTLDWNPSTDNVGVVQYTVHRGGSAGFTVGAGNEIGTSNTTSYTDEGVTPGTYYYKVTARDAEGNLSSSSTAAEVTVAEVVEPTQAELATGADAAVHETVPNNNYGDDTQLWSRGETGQQAFLSFDIPEAPEGTELTGATLHLRTSSDPVAGSTDDHQVSIITGSWTEGGLTWNNRPTNVAAQLGTLSGATERSTPYTVECDPQPLATRAGTTVTVRIFGTGTDNLRLRSSEATATQNRPVLDLSFTPEG